MKCKIILLTCIISFISIGIFSQSDSSFDNKRTHYTQRIVEVHNRVGIVDLNKLNVSLYNLAIRERNPIKAFSDFQLSHEIIKDSIRNILSYIETIRCADSNGYEYDTTISTPLVAEEILNFILCYKVTPSKDFQKYKLKIYGLGFTSYEYLGRKKKERLLFYLDINDVRKNISHKEYKFLMSILHKSLFKNYADKKHKSKFEEILAIKNFKDSNVGSKIFEFAVNNESKVFDDFNFSQTVSPETIKNSTTYNAYRSKKVTIQPDENDLYSCVFKIHKISSTRISIKLMAMGPYMLYPYSYRPWRSPKKLFWINKKEFDEIFAKNEMEFIYEEIFMSFINKKLRLYNENSLRFSYYHRYY